MPTGTRVHKCVEAVKAKGGSANPYAVCQAATGQSFKTGRSLGDKRRRRKKMLQDIANWARKYGRRT